MSSNISALFEDCGVRHMGLARAAASRPAYTRFANMERTRRRSITYMDWEMYGTARERYPGEPIKMGSILPSFPLRIIVRNWALGDFIAMEDWYDDQLGVLNRVIPGKSGALARAHDYTTGQNFAAFIATNGFASGTGIAGMADGVSLFNTAHPVSLNNTQTWSNRFDVDLTMGTLQAAATMLYKQKTTNNQEYTNYKPRYLVVAPELRFLAQQLVAPGREPFTSDNQRNLMADENIEVIVWDYLSISGSVSGTNNGWMLLAEDHGIQFIERQDVQVYMEYDINTHSQIYTTHSRNAWGVSTARGAVGSKGA